MTRKTLKLSEDVYRELDEHKPEHTTWNQYLLDLKDGALGGPVVGVDDESVQKIADEVESRMRR